MSHQSTTTKQSSSRFRFFRETITELKKVVWLSRREATYLTLLVLVVSITVGIILGVIDFGFTELIQTLFLGG
jgi:preprotein translocase subunit SecE